MVMIEDEVVWYGPGILTKVRQVCIPAELLPALRLGAGSELQFALDEERSEIRIRPTGRAKVVSESKE